MFIFFKKIYIFIVFNVLQHISTSVRYRYVADETYTISTSSAGMSILIKASGDGTEQISNIKEMFESLAAQHVQNCELSMKTAGAWDQYGICCLRHFVISYFSYFILFLPILMYFAYVHEIIYVC